MAKSFYKDLVEAGVPVDNHESDLYFQLNDASRELIAKHKPKNLSYFINQAPPHEGEQWADVPFAFDPFWQRKTGR